jgi:hypothetical protein
MKKTIILFERHCHATEKSETIACPWRCRSFRWFTGWWTQKRIIGKMEDQGEEEAQGVAEVLMLLNMFSLKS